jgi:hypothetical protein
MIKRVPIKVKRTPIILPQHIKAQVKIWELQEETKEDDIHDMSRHYDMLVMKATNKAGHTSLPLKNYTEHKNWIHFESIYEICRMKGWDRNLYIEGQFERARNWTRMKYPLPNMMYSVNAIRFHINYFGDIVKKYEKDVGGDKKKRGKETKTLTTQISQGIIKSIELLSEFLDRGKVDDKAQYKALAIFNNWGQLSPFYLYSIPWFHDVLNDLDVKMVEGVKQEFDRIDKSPSMKRTIAETVQQVEKAFNIPHNIQF